MTTSVTLFNVFEPNYNSYIIYPFARPPIVIKYSKEETE